MIIKKFRLIVVINFDKMYLKKKKKINICKLGLFYFNCVIFEIG